MKQLFLGTLFSVFISTQAAQKPDSLVGMLPTHLMSTNISFYTPNPNLEFDSIHDTDMLGALATDMATDDEGASAGAGAGASNPVVRKNSLTSENLFRCPLCKKVYSLHKCVSHTREHHKEGRMGPIKLIELSSERERDYNRDNDDDFIDHSYDTDDDAPDTKGKPRRQKPRKRYTPREIKCLFFQCDRILLSNSFGSHSRVHDWSNHEGPKFIRVTKHAIPSDD